ncbi:MAG TPA: chaperone modulator CbpM [Burkholderiaceae bacterium]|nr:chaperone modulator CbpM [Burkholderiaceae bacterium]
MTSASPALQALLDDATLDAAQLCRIAGIDAHWLQQRVADGLVGACAGGEGTVVQFDAVALRRVRRMVRLERDFDAVPELAALVADLEDEVRALRARLQRLGP